MREDASRRLPRASELWVVAPVLETAAGALGAVSDSTWEPAEKEIGGDASTDAGTEGVLLSESLAPKTVVDGVPLDDALLEGVRVTEGVEWLVLAVVLIVDEGIAVGSFVGVEVLPDVVVCAVGVCEGEEVVI